MAPFQKWFISIFGLGDAGDIRRFFGPIFSGYHSLQGLNLGKHIHQVGLCPVENLFHLPHVFFEFIVLFHGY